MRILGFSGKKGAGKSTASKFLHGHQLKAFNIVDDFGITVDGELIVKTSDEKKESSYTNIDITRRDDEFAEWAAYNMWPYVRNYSFAQPLKALAVELFQLLPEQVYGTDEQKNSPTHLFWEDMPGVVTEKIKLSPQAARSKTGQKLEEISKSLGYHEPGAMTAREFLQFFGTEVCRKVHEDIWTEYLINVISKEEPLLAIIDDIRFPNEVEAIKEAGGKVIRFMRDVHKDQHDSETKLDKYKHFDGIINNNDIDIAETSSQVLGLIEQWDWFGSEVKPGLKENLATIKG